MERNVDEKKRGQGGSKKKKVKRTSKCSNRLEKTNERGDECKNDSEEKQ